MLFDIDWQGTQQLRERARDDLVSVFLLPPSSGELARRLHTRAQDDKKVIRARMAKAGDEMSHWAEYDYVVVNRDLDRAFGDVRAILARRASQARTTNRPVRIRARPAVETLMSHRPRVCAAVAVRLRLAARRSTSASRPIGSANSARPARALPR